MLLKDILSDYKPAYPDNGLWSDTFEMLAENSYDKEIVDTLIAEYTRDGEFRSPIILSTLAEDGGDEDYEYEPYVKNGTHRVYALYLMGVEEVEVQHGYQDVSSEEIYGEEWTPYPNTVTVIKFDKDFSDDEYEDLWDNLMQALCSFKVSDTFWLESDLGVSSNVITVYWAGMEFDEDRLNIINNATAQRIADKVTKEQCITKTVTFFSEEDEQRFHQEAANW